MCLCARNMRSSSPPSVADESSVRRHIIKNSVDPKFRYGVSELKMLHAVRELCGGQVPSARVDDQLPPEAAPAPEAVSFPVVDMLMVRGLDIGHKCMGHRYMGRDDIGHSYI